MMKYRILLVITTFIVMSSCKKDKIETVSLATVSVVNAVLDGKVAKVNSNLRDSCLNMNFKHFTIVAGNQSTIKVFSSGFPNIAYFNQSPNTAAGEIYSLFLGGSQTNPEGILVKENLPPYPDAEVINLRIVNLSPGSAPINLTLGNEPTIDVFANIAYKSVSEFKTVSFPITLPNGRNQFQIRDSSGNLLFTYIMPTTGTVSQASSRRRNISIVYKGTTGGIGTNALGVVVLPHY